MKSFIAALLLATSFPSCATIVSGGPDTFMVNTLPQGAVVTLDDRVVGKSPCQMKVSKLWEAGDLVIRWPDGEKIETTVPRVINPWVFGNLLFGGPIGVVVDCAVGCCRTVNGDGKIYIKPGG